MICFQRWLDVQQNVFNWADSCKNAQKADGCENAENAEEIIAACSAVLKHPFSTQENQHFMEGNPKPSKCYTFGFCLVGFLSPDCFCFDLLKRHSLISVSTARAGDWQVLQPTLAFTAAG